MSVVKTFPGASYDHWKTTNPADAELGPEPDEVACCDICGSEITDPKADNERYDRWGHIYLACDYCITVGDTKTEPEYEPEPDL